jgi:glycosyltransferase involved in cell wall biosynthesis
MVSRRTTMNESNLILVVVPAFNEEFSIQKIVGQIRQSGFDVLVVNDGSTDETSYRAKQAGAIVIDLPFNLGVGGALRSAFQYAVAERYTAVVQVDADGQHPVDQIRNLISEFNHTGADMIIGSRFASKNGKMRVNRLRKVMMKILASNASRATGTELTDVTSGFRIIGGKLLKEFSRSFPVNYLGDTYEAVMTAGLAGYKILEIPADMNNREFGESSASPLQAMTFTLKAILVVILRVHSPIAKK